MACDKKNPRGTIAQLVLRGNCCSMFLGGDHIRDHHCSAVMHEVTLMVVVMAVRMEIMT